MLSWFKSKPVEAEPELKTVEVMLDIKPDITTYELVELLGMISPGAGDFVLPSGPIATFADDPSVFEGGKLRSRHLVLALKSDSTWVR